MTSYEYYMHCQRQKNVEDSGEREKHSVRLEEEHIEGIK